MFRSLVMVTGLVVAAAPALASSCSEEIATLQRRLDSSGAEKVTGEKPAGGTTSSNSPKALVSQPKGNPSDSSTKPTAGGVDEARTLLAKASEEEKAGKTEACRDTVMKAKEQAGSLP